MKFTVLTNPELGNNFVNDLIDAGLRPEILVTQNPFLRKENIFYKIYCKKNS